MQEKHELTELQMHCEKLGITEKEYKRYSGKYEELHLLEVPADENFDKFHYLLVKSPNRHILNEYMKKVEGKPLDGLRLLLNSCLVHGGNEVIDDHKKYIGAASQLQELVRGGSSDITKVTSENIDLLATELGVERTELENLQAKHREIHVIAIPQDLTYDDFEFIVVKTPQVHAINDFLKKSERVPFDAVIQLLSSCVVWGDKKKVLADLAYTSSAGRALSDTIKGAEANLTTILKKK